MGVKMNLEISRESILHKAKTEAYYSGEAKKEDSKLVGIAAKKQADDDDDEILHSYIDTAVSNVIDTLSSLMDYVELTEGEVVSEATGELLATIIFKIDAPSTFDGNSKKTLITGIIDYISNWVLFEWVSIVYPSESNAFFEKAELVMTKIRSRANRRVKPVRRVASPI